MTSNEDRAADGPTTPPTDLDEERRRLLRDAAEHGVDQEDAIDLAERVAQVDTAPDAYRAVDRRLATGYSLEQAEEILLDEAPEPDPDDEPGAKPEPRRAGDEFPMSPG